MKEEVNKNTSISEVSQEKSDTSDLKENVDEVQKKENDKETVDEIKVIDTDKGSKDGQNKCPKCGATDIVLNQKTGKLKCMFCRHEFETIKVEGIEDNLENLKGITIGSGAKNIEVNAKDIITFKCESCGAEVVIDTNEQTNARCHWCRNTLSINQKVPNGAVPDVVLPFSINKNDAVSSINNFVKKRQFYAHPTFKKEFVPENVMGVYLPYMIVDINAHATFKGKGEHQTRMYTRGSGEDKETYYDADLYSIERDFDITIDDLTIESSSDKLNHNDQNKTTNIINSIMPFDIENAVKWDANYLKGFTSEKRDTDVDSLTPIVNEQAKDVARYKINSTLDKYDRGVCWETQSLDSKGQQWIAAYLPVWLYSYQQVKGKKKLLHYVAVNARTKETMGSVPINIPKLFFVSFIVEILSFFSLYMVNFDGEEFLLSAGFIFFFIFYSRYRNAGARHTHELETKSNIKNLKSDDTFIRSLTGLKNSSMYGANNFSVSNPNKHKELLEAVTNTVPGKEIINTISKKEKNNEK